MGSGPTFPNPKYFWSPTGGWNNTPKNYKVNTLVLGGIAVAFMAFGKLVESQVVFDRAAVHSQETVDKWNAAAKLRNKHIEETGQVNINIHDRKIAMVVT
ncbi:hypothetical protein BABINDRAFT_11173 [Babjeviella inositovora NRRL Y-12698]|uniref:Uncharacterized protein n=1 Tax=Babjeviella inositovora NRRL Y-12698 TaxID=984486 RepID=A0A1E3QYV0_9ASCO|nr:uncharacterized protein BABINDRAFT_11173 [Babjeviella inositovora NRRL Y-12698]ODQ82808.1 hypothetical protein BABINDRAFT_11173 [Babjeviella inositovora NRRL Y-12698]